nr:Gag-Pol polyprotein [Tanacetum cinerariifolium]
MFDEYFNPSPSVVSLVSTAAAPRPAEPTGSPSSTSIDQAAPSASTSSTIQETQSLVISKEPSSQESSSNVQPSNPPFDHISKWTKIYLLENVIGDPSRPVSTRKQLQTYAMLCFFNAFPTSVEPKNFKEALLESSWIDAMQEEIYEFRRLDVRELVHCPNLV